MPGRRREKHKSKKHRIKFRGTRLSYIRLAYDIFAYSAKKFRVPENCVSVWKNYSINYECPNFRLVVTRDIIHRQIMMRRTFHQRFQVDYDSNQLDTFSHVSFLFRDVLDFSTNDEDIFEAVESSLAAGCELIIFLHSFDSPLYVRKLARLWFDHYFGKVQKKFERYGGVDTMHKKASKGNCQHSSLDTAFEEFISQHCVSYKASAENLKLRELFLKSLEKDFSDLQEQVKRITIDEACHREDLRQSYAEKKRKSKASVSASTSKSDEASGLDIPMNTGLGIPKHEDLLQSIVDPVAEETPSQNLPGASSQKPVWSPTETDDPIAETTPSQDLPEESSQKPVGKPTETDDPIAETMQSQNLPEESNQKPVGKPTKKNDPIAETTPSQDLPEESSQKPVGKPTETGDPIVETMPSQDLPGPSSQKSVRRRTGTSDRHGRCESEKPYSSIKDLEQMSSDEFEDLLRSYHNPDDDEPSSFGRMSWDSSEDEIPKNPGLGVPQHEDWLRSIRDPVAETSPQKLPTESRQNPARRRREPSGRKGDKSLSVEQGLGQVGLISPALKKSRQKRPSDHTPPQSLSGAQPEETSPQSLSSEKSEETVFQNPPSVRPKEFATLPRRSMDRDRPRTSTSSSGEEE